MAIQVHKVVPDVSARSIKDLISLKDRRAVVTGGAKGIGLAISKRLAEAGAAVTIGDFDTQGAEASAKLLSRDMETKIWWHKVDVTDGPSVTALVGSAVEDMGGIDIWVNNAGIYPTKFIVDMTDDDWDRVLDVNLRGMFIGSREAGKQMIAAGKGGVIINLASTAGFSAMGPGTAHYVASKHGIRGLTKALAVEFGPYGIRVLALAPTVIDTPGIAVLRDQAKQAAGGAPVGDLLEQIAFREPLGRAGVPDDVARVALFCASDLSMLMTGSTLLVDAGDVAI
ncbi:MAG TPA: SDR family NAD(P)-dependent oxidoreductase [Candidatus Acidoferrales bacterium]|nr:SDR family NAD(P)-dependent oxidoreductase [Candidatus Acidoferrales bacterium]